MKPTPRVCITISKPWCSLLVLALCAAMLAGCSSTPTRSRATAATPAGSVGTQRIIDLRMLTSPAPVSFEDEGQPTGIWTQIYALTQGQARAVALPAGRMELLVFDGTGRNARPSEVAPLLTLTYTQTQLQAAASQTIAGMRYSLPVRWDTNALQSGVVTIIARFIPQQQPDQVVYSPSVSVRLRPS